MNRSSTSPFRQGARGTESFEALIRSLERENSSLVEELNAYKERCRKTNELEDKIDMVLKHNTQLLNENERLAKLINQKKSEVDLWKNKHESLSVNRSSTSELEIKRLLNEIEKLKEEACQIEHIKNVQINELKNQQHMDIQSIKRGNLSNAEKYQLQIRKLKEYCDKKDYEISDFNMKMVRMNKETDFQIGKLREEKERLRGDLAYEESEHRKQVEGLKTKFQYNFHSEIENLKKQHMNQIDTLDYENSKLKEVIESKNREIDQIMSKHSKVKSNYEDSISILKKQNDELKDKVIETEHIGELELNNLRDKMEGIKESEIAIVRDAHNNQCNLLNREISKLQKFLEDRNQQIQIISKERNQMRQALQNQIFKGKAELENQINENKTAAIRHQNALTVCDEEMKLKNTEMNTLQSYLQTQIASIKAERDNSNSLLEKRENELRREKNERISAQRKYQSEIQLLKEQSATLRDENQKNSRRFSGDNDDLKKMHELKQQQLQTTIRGLQEEGKQKDVLIQQLRDNISFLQIQVKNSQEKILALEKTQKELRRIAKENQARSDAKEKQQNRLLKEQIQNLERTKRNQIDELKSIQDNKIRTLKHQIKELERNIEDKNRGLNLLKEQYEELLNKFEEIFGRQASKKNLDIKVPGWVPDTLSTKSLFDVFLKNKVIEYCS